MNGKCTIPIEDFDPMLCCPDELIFRVNDHGERCTRCEVKCGPTCNHHKDHGEHYEVN